ncbi:MAG: T9SS type A sorting domain-containing protein [Bacteroidetes bacterium]|nr:T9SS type A sorting domain-containing protein [Bacteroidota bacterium]
MKKRFTTLFLLLALCVFNARLYGQCNQNFCLTPVLSFDASSACILPDEHYLDCYTGETYDSPPYSFPPFWCTSIENNQWFAFVASTTSVDFNIYVDNCDYGGGLQAALLETVDCINFSFVSDCIGNIPAGTSLQLVNNIPLVPGQTYYLMLDGIAGAKCSFTINAGTGIFGPENVCLPASNPFDYYSNSETDWTIIPPVAGTIVSANPAPQVQVQWNQPGSALICAQSVNCSSNNFCLQVNVGQYATTTQTVYLCPGEYVTCGGQLYTIPGVYTNYFYVPNNCDSILICNVVSVQPSNTDLGQVMMPCSGAYEVCGEIFNELGQHQVVCQGWQGCDSTVAVELVQGDVFADVGPDFTFACDASDQAILDASASSQGSNFTYLWTTIDGHIVSGENGLAPTVDAVGTYCLTVTNQNSGCIMTDCLTITDKINIQLDGPDFFCPGFGDLTYQVTTNSSAATFLYFQVNGNVTSTNTTAGLHTYYFDVNLDSTSSISAWAVDATDCSSDTVAMLVNKNNAHIEFELSQTECNVGHLTANLVGDFQNTAENYLWAGMNGAGSPTIPIYQNGAVALTIVDNYGCNWDAVYNVSLDYTGLCAYVEGTLLNNLPGNCMPNTSDIALAGWAIQAVNANATYYGTTDANGHYLIPVVPGDYTVSVLLPPGNGFDACANDFAVSLPSIGATASQDFLVYQLPDCPFMTIDVGCNLLRRCMNNAYYVKYCNQGSSIANDAYIIVTLDADLTFLNAGIPYIALGGNSFRFNVGDVLPGQCASFLISTFLSCNVPIGQIHCVTAQVFPTTICTGYGPSNFTDVDCRPNIGSYDPNAKTALPTGQGTEHYILAGTELTYQIRFQNTGTDTAYNVIVRDTLVDKFELSSLQLGVSSHSYTHNFYGQRILKLSFDDIKLPPVGVNEAASIGYFEFRVKLKDDLPVQDLIENQAFVYFDNNLPVATNIYYHTIGTPANESFQTVHICLGDSYDFNGENLTQSGDYTTVFLASNGGDSTVHLSLFVHPPVVTEIVAQICEGETYVFDNQTLEQSGEYTAQFNTVNGCDSTVVLMLNIVDNIVMDINGTICSGENYIFNNEPLTESGTYTATFTSTGGCDSIVTLTLRVVFPVFVEQVINICDGESVQIGDQIISVADTIVEEMSTWYGCDSTHTTIVNVLPLPQPSSFETAICFGETYDFNGQIITSPGNYEGVFETANGCDSIVTLMLNVYPQNPVTNIEHEVIQGTLFQGILITSDTTIETLLTDMNDCDSLINHHFTVLPNAVHDILWEKQFEVFPNPTSRAFYIRFNLGQVSIVKLKLLDVVGRYMPVPWEASIYGPGEHLVKLEINDLPSGLYFVEFQTNDCKQSAKLVVN